MLFIIKYLKPKFENNNSIPIRPKTTIIAISFLLLLVTSIQIRNKGDNDFRQDLSSNYNTKKGVWVTNEVFKIETHSKLIYIKTPSHNPLVCWTGNGYKITESKEISIGNEKLWMNKMEKNNHNFNSYWWYECGNKKYTSLIEVLLIKLIYNQPIFLINKTSKID